MQWIDEEWGTFHAGDQRRTKRFLRLVTSWWTRVATTITDVCVGWAEQMAAYRLLKCAHVTLAAVLTPHQEATQRRVGAEPVVLDIQDTTVLDYTGQPIARTAGAVGPLTYDYQRGLLAHVRLLVTPDRRPLGVAGVTLLTRTVLESTTKTRSHKQRPLEDKESARWLAGFQGACTVATAAPTTQVISVADREGDLYEVYAEALTASRGVTRREEPLPADRTRPADWLIRACQDRAVLVGPGGRTRSLRLHLALAPCWGLATVAVPATPGQPARQAQCRVSAERVTLRPPYRPGEHLPPVTVTVVAIREYAPPVGATRLEWVLLTSLPVTTWAEIRRVIHYYSCRWEIEVFFRVLKSGCRVEELQVRTRDRLEPCLGICLVLAWRIRAVQRLGELDPTAPCTLAFADDEWRVIAVLATQQSAPATVPPVGQVVRWLALLGGFSGRRADGDPGALLLWRGWQRVQSAIMLQRLLAAEGKCV